MSSTSTPTVNVNVTVNANGNEYRIMLKTTDHEQARTMSGTTGRRTIRTTQNMVHSNLRSS